MAITSSDYNLDVLRGLIAGHSMVLIEGHDEALTTTRTTVTPTATTTNIDQSGLDTTPATVDVASTSANDTSAGSGVRTVTLSGLDSSGVAQSEIITLNGQTEVTSANTYSAVLGLRSVTWGATTWNEGTLWAGNGTFTSGVPATKYFAMGIRQNKGLTAYYVVPAGKTLYVRDATLMISTTNKDVDFFLEQSSNGINWFTEIVFGVEPGDFQDEIRALPGIIAGQHIRIEAKSSASGTDATVILEGELVDD